jgi:hypothetical protein
MMLSLWQKQTNSHRAACSPETQTLLADFCAVHNIMKQNLQCAERHLDNTDKLASELIEIIHEHKISSSILSDSLSSTASTQRGSSSFSLSMRNAASKLKVD